MRKILLITFLLILSILPMIHNSIIQKDSGHNDESNIYATSLLASEKCQSGWSASNVDSVSEIGSGLHWAHDKLMLTDALSAAREIYGDEIKVGIVDSGFDGSHPDLAENIYYSSPHNADTTLHRDFLNYNTLQMFQIEPTPVDWQYPLVTSPHGTIVAGVVAQAFPNVKLVSLKVGNKTEVSLLDTIRAIEFAKNSDIQILNLSICLAFNRVNQYYYARLRDAILDYPVLRLAVL